MKNLSKEEEYKIQKMLNEYYKNLVVEKLEKNWENDLICDEDRKDILNKFKQYQKEIIRKYYIPQTPLQKKMKSLRISDYEK
ncbi:hypothetical protein N3114_10830 [Aliarcobacter butzleri]|uniref:hypothetical protein n=1 Tax=Aliarcobacter butzleri TaxID=28197 RepID=UPI0021B424FA|nr:hypothetical protein [Aliarcobacter butzleri]UXC29133.1 hypothetical protein N3114_10830 [Aliarcobacter butzleri]